MNESRIACYLNGVIMLIGSVSYFLMGFLMTTKFGEISEILQSLMHSFIMILAFGLLFFAFGLLFFAFGMTAGTLIATAQLFYGLFLKFFKKTEMKEHKHHFYGLLLWLSGWVVFGLAIQFDFIVTV